MYAFENNINLFKPTGYINSSQFLLWAIGLNIVEFIINLIPEFGVDYIDILIALILILNLYLTVNLAYKRLVDITAKNSIKTKLYTVLVLILFCLPIVSIIVFWCLFFKNGKISTYYHEQKVTQRLDKIYENQKTSEINNTDYKDLTSVKGL